MARPKFKITTKEEVNILRTYANRNLSKILDDFRKTEDILKIENIEEREKSRTLINEMYDKIIYLDISDNQNFEIFNKFLYSMTADRINKIKITIRAKKSRAKNIRKKQITIDYPVHTNLWLYAEKRHLTLSQAINELLIEAAR